VQLSAFSVVRKNSRFKVQRSRGAGLSLGSVAH
jgi:hypothetical protein